MQNRKILITEDASFDMGTYSWDDYLFSNILAKSNAIEMEHASEISQFLKEQITAMENKTITMPIIDKILRDKMLEYGCNTFSPIRLDKSIFVKNELELTKNAKTVLERRYLKKDRDGRIIETPVQMFRRVAHHIAKAEKKYGGDDARVKKMEDVFYKMMTNFLFLPNSPTLMNAGCSLGQLAACFVLPVEDSMESIFDSLKNAAIIHKSGGGTGFSFSRLRPRNSCVGTTGGIASGPVSFMKVFNMATEQVKQGGTRRGANIAILRVDHPDILEFINCKSNCDELNNFNISVGITDAFIEALNNKSTYDLIDPRTKKKVGELNSAEVYHDIVKHAWENGDPGILFIDRINEDNPTPSLGEIESTNPCGEQPLLPMEACNLGSINLAKFVIDNDKQPTIDYEALMETINQAVRFLDNTIDMSEYPLPEIDKMVKLNRKIGLGVMGFADMLYQLRIPYNSENALELTGDIMRFVQDTSHEASIKLAEERGVFESYANSIFQDQEDRKYRNAATTTIAPTGTLSIIAGCSSGIEPLFALNLIRNVMDNDRLIEINPYFEKVARERGFYSDELMNTIAQKGSIRDIIEIPEDVRKVFVTAHDVSPEMHIRMQAAFQKDTDNAVSKTVNLPEDATVEDVSKIYTLAYELGCKGVTIYRDGSKKNQVLSVHKKHNEVKPVKERPETLEGFTTKIKTGMGQLYVTVTELDNVPFEVFATIGKSGKSTTAKTEAIGRLISLALRAGVKVDEIIKQLKGIGGEHPVFQNGSLVMSIPDAISRVLENKYHTSEQAKKNGTPANSLLGGICPDCGQTISFEEGCMTCHFCGYSKCS